MAVVGPQDPVVQGVLLSHVTGLDTHLTYPSLRAEVRALWATPSSLSGTGHPPILTHQNLRVAAVSSQQSQVPTWLCPSWFLPGLTPSQPQACSLFHLECPSG